MANKRFKQADREALITLGIYVFFFLWWTVFAFGLGGGDPEEYAYVFGLPAWFFFSCVVGYPVVTAVLWFVMRRWFADMPLDAYLEDDGIPGNARAETGPAENPETGDSR